MASTALASSDSAAVSHLMLPNPPPNTQPVGRFCWPSGYYYHRGGIYVEVRCTSCGEHMEIM